MNPSDSRCVDLLRHELERHRILKQCGKKADPLCADFRYDEICLALDKLYSRGLDLKKLFKFQNTTHRVVYPWNTEYNTLRINVNRRFNVFPLIIVICMKKKDVIAALLFAKKYGLKISLRSGSHCFENFSIDGEIIIDQSHRKKFKLLQGASLVKVQAGVLLGPLAEALYREKRMIVLGSAPNNAAVGFSLGGGIGQFTRIHGTSSDNLVAATILLGSGEIIKVHQKKNSDLFWALRGAGNGNFGIVLDVTIKTHFINKVYSFNIKYPFDKLKEALSLWISWIAENPKDLTSDFILHAGRSHPHINGIYLGKQKKLLKRLAILLSIPGAELEKLEKESYLETVREGAGIGRWLPFFKFKNAFLSRPLTPSELETIEEFMAKDDFNSYFVINNLGGKYQEIPSDETAFAHREKLGWFHLNAQWEEQSQATEKLQWVTNFFDQLFPPTSEYQVYQNAPDLKITEALERYYVENLPRLKEIKKKYDPENLFRYPQSL